MPAPTTRVRRQPHMLSTTETQQPQQDWRPRELPQAAHADLGLLEPDTIAGGDDDD